MVECTDHSVVVGEVQPQRGPVVVGRGAQRVQRPAVQRARAAAAQRARRLPHAHAARAQRQPRAAAAEPTPCNRNLRDTPFLMFMLF